MAGEKQINNNIEEQPMNLNKKNQKVHVAPLCSLLTVLFPSQRKFPNRI
jgi:hypothetical protein